MAEQINHEKSLRKGKPTRQSCLPPSCGEFAEQFLELQLLRQQVIAAECERTLKNQKVSSGG
jgi:hypothetical protein